MKNSGIEWIGEIPDSWTCGKLKYVLQSNDGGVWGSDPLENENDKIVLRSTEQTIDGKWAITNPAKRSFSTNICYYRIILGDLLITKSSGSALHIGKTTIAGEFFEQKECYYSNFLQRIRLKKNFLPQYAWYILNSIFVREQFAYMQNSTSGLGNITSSNIDNVFIPMPSMNIQQQIVNILDCKTAYIDKLIEVQQAQIEKLKEYKQSVITEAVTKGLDPTAPMKDSGVEWIGKIPEDWKLIKIGSLFACRNEKVSDSEFSPLSVSRGGIVPQMENVAKSDAGDNRKLVLKNDFVINSRSDRKQSCGVSPLDGSVSLINTVLYSISANVIIPEYVNIVMKNYGFAEEFYRWGHGIVADLWTTRWQEMKSIVLPIPSIEIQKQIVKTLSKRIDTINTLIALKQSKIDKLQEYKKSLIYEYVTGKKEVI